MLDSAVQAVSALATAASAARKQAWHSRYPFVSPWIRLQFGLSGGPFSELDALAAFCERGAMAFGSWPDGCPLARQTWALTGGLALAAAAGVELLVRGADLVTAS